MLGLLLLQVLASCLWLGHSEVVNSFASCPQFFYAGTTPNNALHPTNPALICQNYSGSYRYATLYDRKKRIPVYSAYIFSPPKDCGRPHSWWFVEPQLIDKNSIKEMERETVLVEKYHFTSEQIKQSQAVLDDYKGLKNLDRGHLSPSGHQDSTDSKAATFTLTNIVPQYSLLNQGRWNNYEHKTMSRITTGCTITYVITGAVPGNNPIAEGRVNVPSHIWSAACCVVDKKPTKAWGAIAENNKNEEEEITLGDLENRLKGLYGGKTVTLFNNACPRN
ncbi:ENDD1 protein, partial [Dicaeum eximium]|nr:ENDD1 protein [Dicaeum eximium]